MRFANPKALRSSFACLALAGFTAGGAGAAVTGTVFQDHNADGVRNLTSSPALPAVDPGIAGVTVTAYDTVGTPVATATSCGTTAGGFCTGSNPGFYSLAVPGAGPFRVEFTGLAAGFAAGAFGGGSGTAVQFAVDGDSGVDFGVNQGAAFCQADPDLVTVCYSGGDLLAGPNAGGPLVLNLRSSAGNSSGTLVGGPGGHDDTGYGVGVHPLLIPANQVGSVYGVAVRRRPSTVFVAAYLKAFASFGPGESTGAIFRLTGASTAALFADLNALFPAVPPAAGDNPHPTASTNFASNADEAVSGPLIGKVALGDIEVTADDATLYAVNLFDRRLYRIPVATPAAATRFDIPRGACADPDDARPFALAEDGGLIYVGLVCSAESSDDAADLSAAVYTFDPASDTWSGAPVFTAALDHPRGCANGGPTWPLAGSCGATSMAAWQPWQDNPTATPSVPQPMLTDLAFDNGNLVLALRDRYGDQSSGLIRTAGEILRACRTAGSWTLESNGSCGGVTTAGADTGQGPGPGPGPAVGFGEYYHGDRYTDFHAELGMGSLVQIPGFPDVATTVFDPVFAGGGTTFDGGLRWLRNTAVDGTFGPGDLTRSYRLYNDTGDFAPGDPFFGKANGLGDVEALCDPAPLEIGNRIWMDSDGDGVQDPGEMPVAGVPVLLYDAAGTLIGATVTDADGGWIFTFQVGASDSEPDDAQVVAPDPYAQQVYVVIDPAAFGPGGALEGKAATALHNDGGVNGTARDSDAAPVTVPVVGGRTGTTVVLGEPGENDHSLDFGFAAIAEVPTFDFGDLPDGLPGLPDYPTGLADDGARHLVVPGLFMGVSVDAELDGQPDAGASGDDATDDENGVAAADLVLRPGVANSIPVRVTNTTGEAATLCGFLDINADGDFADPGETAQAVVPNGSSGALVPLAFTLPPGVTSLSTYARFRLSTDLGCSPSGAAGDGEVEDYAVQISPIAIPVHGPFGLGLLVLGLAAAALYFLKAHR